MRTSGVCPGCGHAIGLKITAETELIQNEPTKKVEIASVEVEEIDGKQTITNTKSAGVQSDTGKSNTASTNRSNKQKTKPNTAKDSTNGSK